MNKIYTTTDPISSYIIYKPPINKWECKINHYVSFHMEKAPNCFHRLMQRLILGFKWNKL